MIAPRSAPNGSESMPPTPRALTLRGGPEFAQALAEGLGVVEAARRAGIHRRTASKRLQDPDLRAYVARLRAEMLDGAQGRLTAGLDRAADVLIELLDDENSFCRLQAARALFETALRVREVVDLEERLQAIEERLRAQEREEPTPAATRRW